MLDFQRRFDAVYVVSDLHLGGRPGFQIFDQGDRLGRFIRWVADQQFGRVALVLNGDVIDSLAEQLGEKVYVALDEQMAASLIARIVDDGAFVPVWAALRAFLAGDGRDLIFVVGNHDVELGLPVVEELLRQNLSEGCEERRARMTFATHGGGFTCHVGNARVFCTHGNEVDPWNSVDHGKLSELSNAQNAGRRVSADSWEPNLGTRFVIDVMNRVKARYPFVDLLKPEVASVAAVLSVLDLDMLSSFDFRIALMVAGGWKGKRRVADLLIDGHDLGEVTQAEVPVTDIAAGLLGPRLLNAVNDRSRTDEDELLLAAAGLVERTPGGVATGDDELLSLADAAHIASGALALLQARLGRLPPAEALRLALKDWLEDCGDDAFDDRTDKLFVRMRDRVGYEVDFIVTGHTHKPRALAYDDGRCFFNSGTWIRQLRIPPELLDDRDAFESVIWPRLKRTSIDVLNAPLEDRHSPDPLAVDRTHAVRILCSSEGTVGELLRVGTGSNGAVEVIPEPGTTLRAR